MTYTPFTQFAPSSFAPAPTSAPTAPSFGSQKPAHRPSPYHVQAMISFGIALVVVVVGETLLPVPAWTRAFLALGTLYLVNSSFTLAKSIRDQQERDTVVSRIDQARVERILAEYDPYRVPTVTTTSTGTSTGTVTNAEPEPAHAPDPHLVLPAYSA